MKINNTHISSLIKVISVILLIEGCSHGRRNLVVDVDRDTDDRTRNLRINVDRGTDDCEWEDEEESIDQDDPYGPGQVGITGDSASLEEYNRPSKYLVKNPEKGFFKLFKYLTDSRAPIKHIAFLLNHHPGKERGKYYLFKKVKCGLLHYAAAQGNLDVVKLLIEDRGIEVDVEAEEFKATPLHFAALRGNLEIVKYLTDMGAKIDTKDSGGAAPIYYATDGEHIDVLRFLIETKKADTNIQEDCTGWTIVHCALSRQNRELADYIIAAVSKDTLDKKDKYGITPWRLAKELGQNEVACAIEKMKKYKISRLLRNS